MRKYIRERVISEKKAGFFDDLDCVLNYDDVIGKKPLLTRRGID